MSVCYYRRGRQFDVSAFFLEGRKVTRMDFFDWNMIDRIANVGTFIIALLTYFKGKK